MLLCTALQLIVLPLPAEHKPDRGQVESRTSRKGGTGNADSPEKATEELVFSRLQSFPAIKLGLTIFSMKFRNRQAPSPIQNVTVVLVIMPLLFPIVPLSSVLCRSQPPLDTEEESAAQVQSNVLKSARLMILCQGLKRPKTPVLSRYPSPSCI